MKKLAEIKRGQPVPDNARLIKAGSKTTRDHASRGGYELTEWDLFEVPVTETGTTSTRLNEIAAFGSVKPRL